MKKSELKKKSSEGLKSNLKGIQIITIALLFVIGMLLGVTIYGIMTKGMDAVFISLLVVGIGCSAILPLQFITMKKIKEELKSRKTTS